MEILSLPYYVTRGNKVFTWEEKKKEFREAQHCSQTIPKGQDVLFEVA